MAQKKSAGKSVEVFVRPGQQVIIKTSPRMDDIDSPFFMRWAAACRDLPADIWPQTQKHHVKCRKIPIWCACPKKHIRIADMHTMQLVNSIKWCARLADRVISKAAFGAFGYSKAALLASVPQWAELLNEAEKRNLVIVGRYEHGGEVYYAEWFRESRVALGMRALEGKKPGEL